MMIYKEILRCRSCNSSKLTTVLDLGNLCISDFILPDGKEEQAPLELVYCMDCSLVQLRHTVNRDHLYKAQYYYHSGLNESMRTSLRDVVHDSMRMVRIKPGDKVLDIGCNDGTMLSFFPRNLELFGYEPATNLQLEAGKKCGGTIYPDYFPSKTWWMPDKYKLIYSIAQFYNIDDPNEYLAAIKDCLHEDGAWIVQFQDLEGMIACNGFDNICHEHTMYIGQEAFMRMLDRHGLYVYGISHNNTNGGSVRYTVKHGKRQGKGKIEPQSMKKFAAKVEQLKSDTLSLLHNLNNHACTVVGIAASTKANTLLQYYGITPDLIPAIAERNPDKYGKITVGTHIPIIAEEEMKEYDPDYLLALAWHFIEGFKDRYGRVDWIVPLPELKIVRGV